MMRIETVDLHHQVLTAWASYRSTLAEAPAVVTFDHHTDTLPAFGRAAADEAERRKWIAAVDFREPAAVKAAISRLCHDEHLDLAVKAGIASRSIVVAHADHPGCADSRIQVTADASWPDLNLLLNDPDRFRPLADRVFEEEWLAARLAAAGFVPEEHPGFIFDLDLDYVLTEKALRPDRPGLLRRLLANAGLITLSREDDWLRLLRIDPVTPDSLIRLLMQTVSGEITEPVRRTCNGF